MAADVDKFPDELSTLDFVNWLTSATAEGRILWEQRPNLITATLAGAMLVQFLTSVVENGDEQWRLFTICDAQGDEIYRATWLTAGNGVPPAAPGIDALFQAASCLCRVN